MITAHSVPIDQLYFVWPKVEALLEKSLEHGTGDFGAEHLKVWLLSGEQQLLVFIEDGEIVGCATVSFMNQPNHRIAFITACAGKGIVQEDVLSQLEEWFRSVGVTKMQAWAKDAQARLYKQKVGFELVCHIVEKKL
jgi:hypothetical protein